MTAHGKPPIPKDKEATFNKDATKIKAEAAILLANKAVINHLCLGLSDTNHI